MPYNSSSNDLVRKTKEKEIIKAGGFYNSNGVWNSIVTIPGDPHVYRGRVETIIIRDHKEVFLKMKPDGEYFLPGGSLEKDIPDIDQAINECMEEARINIRNIESSGIYYKKMKDKIPEKESKTIHWDGSYTQIFVAEYDSIYTGEIQKTDIDPFILSGRFYPTKKCFKFMIPEHREALLWYLQNHLKENELIGESVYADTINKFIHNYIKTPEDLSSWMQSNIKYDHNDKTWKLRNPNEVYKTHKGDCHDQTAFEGYVFDRLHITYGKLFMIATTGTDSEDCGSTHSVLYYVKNKKYYWFENAWEDEAGIHGPYDNLNALKSDIRDKFPKEEKYPELYMTDVKNVKYGMNLDSYVKACCKEESGKSIFESSNEHKIYFLSEKYMDGSVLEPRIPNNYFTQNGYEDNRTKRVCFSTSIDGALMALSKRCMGLELYVYEAEHTKYYKPSLKEVPDSAITKEVWVKKPVQIHCIGKIKVIGDSGNDGYEFTYGKKTAMLYDWDWKWIEKKGDHNDMINESVIDESSNKSELIPDFKKKTGKTFNYYDLNDKKAFYYMNRDDQITEKKMQYIRDTFKGCIAVDKKENKYAGYVWITKKDNTISPLWVFKDYRGYGLGEELLKKSIKEYKANGLWVYTDNKVAINLYKKFGFYETKHREKRKDGELVFMNLNEKEVITESGLKSSLDKNFHKKGIKKLSSFKKVEITKEKCKELSKTYKYLKHIRISDNSKGYFFMDDDKIACTIMVETKEDKTKWIQALEVSDVYQSYGLGKQLLDFACKNLKAEYLSVYKDNEIALNMYKKYGFKIFKDTGHMYFMTLTNTTDNIKKESNVTESTDMTHRELNKKCFDDFVHYVKWVQHDCDPYFCNIKPLKSPIVHKSSKGYDMLLLAVYNGKLTKENYKKFLPSLSQNVNYGDESVEFHTCYLPGDVFIFIKIPKLKTVEEKCTDLKSARELTSKVRALAKEYDANFYFVTDGASATLNNGNQAVNVARNAVAKWERENGFDDVEDWRDNPDDTSNYHLKKESAESDDLYEEGLKEVIDKVNDKAAKSAKPINDTINKGTDAIARKVIRAPKEGSDSHVYDEYEKKVNKIKANLKITAIGAANVAVFAIPMPGSSAIFNTVVLAGLKTSEDPSDAIVKDKLAQLKNKVNSLKSHISSFFAKNKEGFKSELEAKKNFSALDAETSLLAKQIDTIRNNTSNRKLATESVHSFDSLLIESLSDDLSLDFYEYVNEAIRNSNTIEELIYCESLVDHLFKDINMMTESKLSTSDRKSLDDEIFGIPELRKYPLNDKSHVLSAIRFFNRVEIKYEEELATNIIKAMLKYHISFDVVGEKNHLIRYHDIYEELKKEGEN